MKLYGKTFALNKTAIDPAATEYAPCEGTIINLNIDKIEGLREQLYQCGFSDHKRKRIIESLYLFVADGTEECVLCIKYARENIRVIPDAGYHITMSELQNLCMVS